MNPPKRSLIKYRAQAEGKTAVKRKTARVADVNEKPPAVKVAGFHLPRDPVDQFHGPRRRRWIPTEWVEDVLEPSHPGTPLSP